MHRPTDRSTAAVIVAAVFALLMYATPMRSIADPLERVLSSPTDWVWYYNVTGSQLQTILSNGNARIVDLQVESATAIDEPVFTVAMVANTGVYAKGWWWYYGQTASQVSSAASTNNARLISIAPYVVNGAVYFASVMVPNTGTDEKGWFWWVGTQAQIRADLSNSGARLVDLEPINTAAGNRYAAIAVANTGEDEDSWWWYLNDSPFAISVQLSEKKAQLLTLNAKPGGEGVFDAVMQGHPTAASYYYSRVTADNLTDLIIENGSRLTELRSDFFTGTRLFNAIMIDNSQPCTSRVIGIQHANGTGWNGDYLEQIAGAGATQGPVVDCSAADARLFEPASSIKVVIGAYVMSLVEAKIETLNKQVPLLDPNNVCGFTQIGTETVQQALTQMLENSDNSRTNMFLQRYGLDAVNAYAQSLGLSNTRFNSLIDCSGPHNTFTLDDAATLYTGLAKHKILKAGSVDNLFSFMAGRSYDFAGTWGAMQSIISAIAPASLTPAQIASFEAGITLTYKSGGYYWPGGIPDIHGETAYGDTSIAGVVAIPYCKATAVEKRTFVFGFFHESTASDADITPVFDAMGAGAEMLRERLRTALASWHLCG